MPTTIERTTFNVQTFDTSDELWRAEAACASVPNAPDLFFSETLDGIAAAKRICMQCPAIAECLDAAVNRSEPCGVWGGQLFLKGRILATKRRRGRPPKNPRVDDQMPVLPVPEQFQRLIA